MTYGEVAEEWLSDQEARVAAGDLARSTLAGYRDELERHVLPVFGGRRCPTLQSPTSHQLSQQVHR